MKKLEHYESPSVNLIRIETYASLLTGSDLSQSGSAELENAIDGGYFGDIF